MDEKESLFKRSLSRRDLLKGAGAIGAMATATSIAKIPGLSTSDEAYAITETDMMPVEISDDYQRMDQKFTVFGRAGWDPEIMQVMPVVMGKRLGHIPYSGEPGFTEEDFALSTAAWSLEEDAGGQAVALGVPNMGLYSWEGHINPKKKIFDSLEQASEKVKRAAGFLGADLVGIAPYDERWVYSDSYNPLIQEGEPIKLPFQPKSVIVMAVEMDYEAYRTSPSLIADAGTATGYGDMITTAHKVAVFCRTLGYNAIPCGNDTAISIPMAIQAGLGEISRMGLLITPTYGPRVRLCKVFTDLPLIPDKPITFGVTDFCKVCLKCADNCPSEAISKDPEPSFKTVSISNNPGVKKWAVKQENCFKYWGENVSCSVCISCCPYNKIDEWHHDMAKLATHTPAKPLLRYFDELFGFGKSFDTAYAAKWWSKK